MKNITCKQAAATAAVGVVAGRAYAARNADEAEFQAGRRAAKRQIMGTRPDSALRRPFRRARYRLGLVVLAPMLDRLYAAQEIDFDDLEDAKADGISEVLKARQIALEAREDLFGTIVGCNEGVVFGRDERFVKLRSRLDAATLAAVPRSVPRSERPAIAAAAI